MGTWIADEWWFLQHLTGALVCDLYQSRRDLLILGPPNTIPARQTETPDIYEFWFFAFDKSLNLFSDYCWCLLLIYSRKRQWIFTSFPQQVILCIDWVV